MAHTARVALLLELICLQLIVFLLQLPLIRLELAILLLELILIRLQLAVLLFDRIQPCVILLFNHDRSIHDCRHDHCNQNTEKYPCSPIFISAAFFVILLFHHIVSISFDRYTSAMGSSTKKPTT